MHNIKLDTLLLGRFFDLLNQSGYKYCVMNNYTNMPEIIPSDVDFAVEINLFNKLDDIVSTFAKRNDVVVTQKIWHGYNKCAYILSPSSVSGFFRLQLDFFVDFCAKGFPNLMPINEMLKNRKKFKNFYIPSPSVEAPFVMQRRIFKGDIEQRHLQILRDLLERNANDVEKGFIKVFGDKFGFELLDVIRFNKIEHFKSKRKDYYELLKKLSSRNTSITYRFKYTLMQAVRAYYRLSQPVGMNIFVDSSLLEIIDLNKFLDSMSGSFHGTSLEILDFNNMSAFSKIKYLLVKRWHKTTKKISVVAFDCMNNNPIPLLVAISSVDIIITSKDISPDLSLESLLNLAIVTQSTKTSQQLGLLFSPTKKGYGSVS
ncbi:hypothetical protein FXE63_13850 [Vibrio mimicus]|uniref:hypothetical protein n=1 Tax=Vibrio mimicus TaxID=674 RepID=UPI0011D59302|nr:hypothetical protein [Vibrio mimicus]TXZ07028.1 hypothetical protein FXE63_13850 [Vibrio mimicus]BCN22641.1 hypothetical protein [Vibrio mimicus]BCN22725.1 hypothetical protein [Vibrio mimicus]